MSNARSDIFDAVYGNKYEYAELVKLVAGASIADINFNRGWGSSTALVYACERGCTDVVKLLVDAKADLNVTPTSKRTPLGEACNNGHLEIVRMLVAAGANVCLSGYCGAPLACACSGGHVEIVEFLLTTDAKRDAQEDMLALKFACQKGNAAVVQLLVDAGANMLWELGEKNNIMEAAEKGYADVVSILLSVPVFRAKVDALDKCVVQKGDTALSLAAAAGHADVVKLLLDAGASKGPCEKVSRHLFLDWLEVLQALISAGADMGARTKDGGTLLMTASALGHAGIVQLLLTVSTAAGRDAEDENGCTALYLAAANGHEKVLEKLVHAGASGDSWVGSVSALEQAFVGGHVASAKVLLDAGAGLAAVQSQRLTDAALAACAEGRIEALQVLTSAGADMGARSKVGRTLLMAAAEKGHAGIVQLLLTVSTAAGRDAEDESGCTALWLAAKNCHAEVVKLLVDAGADASLQDSGLIWRSCEDDKAEMVKLLLECGAQIPNKEKNDRTLLMMVAEKGYAAVLGQLLRVRVLQASKDAQNKEGDTAILFAVKNGHAEVVQLLVDAGADIHIKNKRGKSARSVALTTEVKSILSCVDTFEYSCAQMQKQAAEVPCTRDALQRLEAAQAQYDAAEAAAEGVERIVSLGKALEALQQESAQLPLSNEDYLTLPARHAQLVQRLEERCKELKKAKDYGGLEKMGALLEALKPLELPVIPQVAPESSKSAFRLPLASLFGLGAANASVPATQADVACLLSIAAELRAACDGLTTQAGQAPQRAEMMQRLEAAQAQYDAAEAAFKDLPLVANLGEALHNLQQESAQLPLSEEDYLTLPARHAQLVSRLLQTCKDLTNAKQFDHLAALSEKLKGLRALELPSVHTPGTKRAQAHTLSKSVTDRLLKSCAELRSSFEPHIQQVALAAQRSSVMQRLEVAQAQYDTADAAGDFKSIGALGKALAAVKAESDKIPLTQKDYLTLADRHTQLVQRVVNKCQELAKAGKYVEMMTLAGELDTLKALDVCALPPPTAAKAPAPRSALVPPRSVATPESAGGERKGEASKGADKDDPGKRPADTSPASTQVDPGYESEHDVQPSSQHQVQDAPRSEAGPALLTASPHECRSLLEGSPTADSLPEEHPAAKTEPPNEAVPSDRKEEEGNAETEAGNGTSAALAAAAVFTDQDRGALTAFLQHSTDSQQNNARLQQVMRTVAAHDRTLQMLVSKEKECPSLFWFYPKKPELRRWLSDPAKCLFQDTLMMVVVCPVTLCIVECGPDGVGWEVNKPKGWVKKWGPAILFSIYVMQAAVVAGRVVGIPLPPLPGAGEMQEALGLKGMLGGLLSRGYEEADLGGSLAAFQEVTIAELEQTAETQALIQGLSRGDQSDRSAPLPADLPMHMVGEAYKSIHTFLTTGENAALGKLEDQLRGRMERVMAPDGDVEWVSVQGRDAWLQKRAAASTGDSAETIATTDKSPLPSAPTPLSAPTTPEPPTWLGEKLTAAGIAVELVQLCDRVLVREQGFGSEKGLARMLSTEFDRAYLTSVGIGAKGLQLELLELHRELRNAGVPAAPAPLSKEASARFTEEDRQLLRQLKLQQRAPEPTTTHTVDKGNQMQLTASAFSQQGPQGALDQQQLARRIAELEARLAETQGVVTEHITVTTLQFENNAQGRSDSPLPSSPSPDTDAAAAAQKGCCTVS